MNEPLRISRRALRWLAARCIAPLVFLALLASPSAALGTPNTPSKHPMRVALVCGGISGDFYDILFNIARGLRELGVIQHAPHAGTAAGDIAALWQWLSTHAGGERLQFLADGLYTADWSEDKRVAQREALHTRLATRGDVDVILALGTWSGLDMARLDTNVPVVVCGVTDAVDAGIVTSVVDSGKDNLVAVVEPDRFLRQIELFHRFFDFRRLGIIYTDSPAERSIAAIDQIETACERRGVELVRCTGEFFHTPDSEHIATQMSTCFRKFVKERVDAVYITYNSLHGEQLQRVLEPLVVANIPTISQTGPREVRMGVLASITNYSKLEGRFVARLLRQLLAGVPPRKLSQRIKSPMLLSINVHTAARIGWNPSLEILLSVDEFFQ